MNDDAMEHSLRASEINKHKLTIIKDHMNILENGIRDFQSSLLSPFLDAIEQLLKEDKKHGE